MSLKPISGYLFFGNSEDDKASIALVAQLKTKRLEIRSATGSNLQTPHLVISEDPKFLCGPGVLEFLKTLVQEELENKSSE